MKTVKASRYARPKEVCHYMCISRSTLCEWRKTRPGFPKPIKAGQRALLFDLNAIDAWLESQKESADE